MWMRNTTNLLYYSFHYPNYSSVSLSPMHRWRMLILACTCHHGTPWGTSLLRWTAMPSWQTGRTVPSRPSPTTSGGSSVSWGEVGTVKLYSALLNFTIFITPIFCQFYHISVLHYCSLSFIILSLSSLAIQFASLLSFHFAKLIKKLSAFYCASIHFMERSSPLNIWFFPTKVVTF